MKKWMAEDWAFEIEILRGEPKNCRIGLEKGDVFRFEYACPADFCPRAMAEIHTWCEVVRCGGDFTYRGSPEKYELELDCPCGVLSMKLHAIPINRDENGQYIGRQTDTDNDFRYRE